MERHRQAFSEFMIYDILKHFCSEDEAIVVGPTNLQLISKGKIFYPDFYLPNGCKALGLLPKTIIEIKSDSLFGARQQYRIIHDYFYSKIKEKGYHFIYLIVGKNNESSIKEKGFFLLSIPNHDDFQIKTLPELLKRQNKEIKVLNNIKEQNRGKLAFENAATAIKKMRCSFILGAGVSIDSNLPCWDELLKRLIDIAQQIHGLSIDNSDYDKLFRDCGSSSIILGRFVQTMFNNKEIDFKNAIQQALYNGIEVEPGELAKAICKLIKYKYEQNSLSSIITYNYDDLIEKGLDELNIMNIPVFGNQAQSEYTPVFHVHGYLPQDVNDVSTIVLSEREYHEIYKQAYHWSNVEQLHAMQRSVCFFIGLSMTDPNLRRLLDIAYGYQLQGNNLDIRHFAFLRKANAAEGLTGKKAEEFCEKMEEMLRGLGVAVIWYNEHSELPQLLYKLMK